MLIALLCGAQAIQAQGARGYVGAQAIGVLTHATPAMAGRSLTEAYLTQPMVMGSLQLWEDRVRLMGMLNLEGLTLRRGELNAGIWGEGYVDRRHPHTYLHEAMATLRLAGARGGAHEITLSLGKGVVPFGSDDPMVRPFVKYPANHHLAQVLERLVAVAAVRIGPAIVETGIFNGDEPDSPSHLGTPERFGDSWSARATLLPTRGLEIAGSYGFVASPEFRAGSGLDHRKHSVVLRYESIPHRAVERYALVEWVRTDDYSGQRRSFSFHSVLAEAALRRRGTTVAVRFERTVRPEEERLLDPFRSARPHADANILGATRWEIATARVSRALTVQGLGSEAFLEIAHLRARETLRPTVFVPAEFYGAERMWSLSGGLQLRVGHTHRRMGRYGAAHARASPAPAVHEH